MSVGYANKAHRAFAQIVWALLATSCTTSPAAAPQTSVRLEPTPASASNPQADRGSNGRTPAPLPALPTSSGTISDGGGPRIQALDADGLELGVVVRALAQQFNLQYQVDPSVRGKVYARLRNATLSEALNQILPQGATYDISNRTLRVSAARMETRTFTLDYVALSRVGMASTVIQRRLGASAGGFGQGAQSGALVASGAAGASGALGGADVITATTVANVWEDIRIAVEALVFERPSTVSGAGASAPTSPFGASGTTSYGRSEADGRRLIINPMAGSITVSSYPAALAEIEVFIKAFEASIQRQVLIEAKIVEVSLEDSTEFGIDWNLIIRNDRALTLRSGPVASQGSSGNIEFRLAGGEITAVLSALQTQGNVRVLSSPRVSALNNPRAVFNVTTGEIVFTTIRTQTGVNPNGTPIFETQVTPNQVNVGIVLDVVPQISADNGVTMNIRPVVTSVSRTATFVQDNATHTAPVIDTRESDTMARMRGGETIVIGGLMQTRTVRIESGVPVLKSIPLLGRLFKHTRNVEKRSELVIFLTPTIISGQPPAGR
jgi:MSHA biogenesis protein MshL